MLNTQNLVVQERSVLNITSPNASTVWMLPNTVTLEWSTTNIGSEKTIRFFLIRDEMVVQELGIFPNTGYARNIKLAKNVGEGNHYKVMGIELFPDDKYNIAKFATPFFSIKKEVKILPAVAGQTNAAQPKTTKQKAAKPEVKKTTKREKRRLKKSKRKMTSNLDVKTNPIPTSENVAPVTINREEFAGRNISYVKDLVFKSTEISIYVWDHGRQDGDIVSIYLNGKPVLSKYYLTYWKKEIKIKVDPNKPNDLFLYAHNLGDAPPNTVSIKITDGKTSENIILNSDLKRCEAVLITVTE